MRLETGGAAADFVSMRATTNLFDVLDVKPALGRLFRAEDETPRARCRCRAGSQRMDARVWRRSRRDWQARQPDAVPEADDLRDRRRSATWHRVSVTASKPVELFRPYVVSAAERDHRSGGRSYGLHVVGRLRAGATLAQARADVKQVTAAVRATYRTVPGLVTGPSFSRCTIVWSGRRSRGCCWCSRRSASS